MFSVCRRSSTTVFPSSSPPSLDTTVNCLCGLWASSKKLVSQSNGSLLAEEEGHISVEVTCEDLAPTSHGPHSHLPVTLCHSLCFTSYWKYRKSSLCVGTCQDLEEDQRCRDIHLMLPSVLSRPFYWRCNGSQIFPVLVVFFLERIIFLACAKNTQKSSVLNRLCLRHHH